MKLSRRLTLPLAGVLILGTLLAAAFWPRAVPVETARAERGPLRITVDEDGRTRVRERYGVAAPIAGQLRRLTLHPGDAVVAEQTVLAVIDPAEPELLDPRLQAQLEARLRAAEAQVPLAASREERARAADELARADLRRAIDLAERRVLAAQELDRARETARAAAEEVKSAAYLRQIAQFELEQARAALRRFTPSEAGAAPGGEFCIRSPITGCVLRVFHEDAAVVTPGARLLEVGDPADLEAEIDVLSTEAVRIAPGARVWFEHWGGETPLEGRVRVVEPAGFLKISALGVEEQRVNVIADFVTPAEQRRTLGDAYRVDARIVVWESADVLKVPIGALFRLRGEWSVYRVEGGHARLTAVVPGGSDGRETEIREGLAPGTSVIVHPSDRVADGVAVKLRRSP